MKPYIPYEHMLDKNLKNPVHALGYLRTCLEDEDERVFLIALKDIARVYGGLTKLARAAHMSREHLYDMLSDKGNPGFISLRALLDALGYKLSIVRKKRSKLKEAA